MFGSIKEYLNQQLNEIQESGLQKAERIITTPQDAHIRVGQGQQVLKATNNG